MTPKRYTRINELADAVLEIPSLSTYAHQTNAPGCVRRCVSERLRASAQSVSEAPGQRDGMAAARDVLARCLGRRAQDFQLSAIPSENGYSVIEVSASADRVSAKGSSPVAALRGVYSYLRDNHLGMITWSGQRLETPARWVQRYLIPCASRRARPCSVAISHLVGFVCRRLLRSRALPSPPWSDYQVVGG
jgi:hypothetical protein